MPKITIQNCKTTAHAFERIPPKELWELIHSRLGSEAGRLIMKEKLLTYTSTPEDDIVLHKLTGFIMNDAEFRCLNILIKALIEMCPDNYDRRDVIKRINDLFEGEKK